MGLKRIYSNKGIYDCKSNTVTRSGGARPMETVI